MVQYFSMINRRRFISSSAQLSAALLVSRDIFSKQILTRFKRNNESANPIVISTWAPNVKANKAAWEVLGPGGRALDAVVKGVQVPEADPEDTSVGYGGYPDRDGHVTLDSCVMDEFGNCGSVMALEHIIHAVLVARLVMEKTPHVQIVGEGA